MITLAPEAMTNRFAAFCHEHPPEARILHSCGSWSSCAVGEFARSIEISPDDVADAIAAETGRVGYGSGLLWDILNNARNPYRAEERINTYGQLQSILTRLGFPAQQTVHTAGPRHISEILAEEVKRLSPRP